MKVRTLVGKSLFLSIIGIQGFATFSNSQTYPLSPYRMFSKHWPQGVMMENVRIEAGTQEYRPWDLVDIPFFQANALMYRTFLDPSSAKQRKRLCGLLARKLERKTNLSIIRSLVQYGAHDRSAAITVETDRTVAFVCKNLEQI